ncbi:TetR/AcrR family transcriptional regulator [Mycolicibacterium goodii]|uniref:HTH tetR-type domain-containing protein n=1 Tax=Mycolicibacterium goodii TaxID=134601 RepID=A0A0K0X6N7_MYCGD|nr:hypothetical protein AFA91_15670 [Mycolicibacterium goodii]
MSGHRSEPPELPRALAMLWAEREAGIRAGRGLSRERIVSAAIDLADAHGFAALSMARLAERLDCGTMSLYRHVANKDELLTFMLATAPGPPPAPDAALRALAGTGLGSREQVAAVMSVLHYVRGAAAIEVEAPEAEQITARDYALLLRRLVTAEAFPALAAVVEAGAFDRDDARFDDDATFLAGLHQLLDGIGTRIDA